MPANMTLVNNRKWLLFLGLVLAWGLFLFGFSPGAFFYDESLYMANMPLYLEKGLSRSFLTEMKMQAPGPLYQVIHAPFYKATGGNPYAARILNASFAVAMVLAIRSVTRSRGVDISEFRILVICCAIPMFLTVVGIALTELPSMTLAICAYAFYEKARTAPDGSRGAWLWLGAGACSVGLSFAGRSPFLVMFPALLLLVADFTTRFRRVLFAVSLLVSFLAFVLPLALVWQGLVPPPVQFVGEGIVPWHGILGLGYLGLCIGLVDYRFLLAPFKVLSGRQAALAFAGAVLGCGLLRAYVFQKPFVPMGPVLDRVLPEFLVNAIGFGFPVAILLLSFLTLTSLVVRILSARSNLQRSALAAALLLTLTSVKVVHLFSSRYTAQAIPFVVLAVILENRTFGKRQYFLWAAGTLVGFVALVGKYRL